MTIQSETNRWAYVLDGVTTDYDYDQKIYESSDLVVQVYNTTTLAATTLAETTDYTVTGAGESAGGTVVLVTPASYSAIHKLIIRRVLPLTQESDFVENTAFLAEVVEDALDRSAIRDQQLQEQLDRAVKRDVTQTAEITLPEPEANKLVGWNAAGTDLENKVSLDADVQAAAEAAAASAVTAQGLAEAARDAAIEAQEAAETVAGWEVASQAEAEAGTDNTKVMTPLKVSQAITELQDDDIPLTYLDTTTTLGTSDTKVPTQKAVKTYVDAKAFGSWSSKSQDTSYQADTDGFVIAHAEHSSVANLNGYTDSNATPTTLRADAISRATATVTVTITMPVRKNDYWKVTGTAGATVYWIPLGA